MKKIPPFVSNSKDDMRCVNAVFRMVHQYFFGKDLSWKEIDKLTKAVSGKGTWTFVGMTEFSKKGINIIHIEPINYQKLYEQGPEYLRKIVGKNAADYYINKSNISSVIKYIPDFLRRVKNIERKATTIDIKRYLKKGYLVAVEVNSSILNNDPGFNLHYVLIYDFDGKNFILHDPGLPPLKSRKVSVEEFEKAFNFPGADTSLTAFYK